MTKLFAELAILLIRLWFRAELSHAHKTKDLLELDKSYLSRELTTMSLKVMEHYQPKLLSPANCGGADSRLCLYQYDECSRLVDAQKTKTSTSELKASLSISSKTN